MKIKLTVTPPNIIKYPSHSHDTWELMCYLSGKGHLETSNGSYPFEKGTIIAVPPGERHGSCGEGFFSNICIHADFEMSESRAIYIPKGTEEQTALFGIIKELYFDNRHSAVIPNLILALKDLISIDANTGITETEKVHNFISRNYMDSKLDVAELIAQTGYSDDFFRTQFRERYGITPRQHLESLRLEYALELIKTYRNKMRIRDVASLCGFNDELYFSRRFRKKYGISPLHYLKGEETNEKD